MCGTGSCAGFLLVEMMKKNNSLNIRILHNCHSHEQFCTFVYFHKTGTKMGAKIVQSLLVISLISFICVVFLRHWRHCWK